MSNTGCMWHHPMTFCMECGCWMNCKRDGIDLEYRRRPDVPESCPDDLIEKVDEVIRDASHQSPPANHQPEDTTR
jgi:hypothetical protein